MQQYTLNKICCHFKKESLQLLSSKPSSRILNRKRINFLDGEAPMHHYVWYNVIRDMGVSMATERYLKVNEIISIFFDQV